MFSDLLTKLLAIKDKLTDPVIPQAIDDAADLLHTYAEYIRKLQGGLTFASPDEEASFAACEECVKEICAPRAAGVGITPSEILVIIQLVQGLWELIKKRRQG